MPELADILGSLNAPVLSALARKLGLPRTVTHKPDADETTAALIAHDAQAGKHCRLAGGKHLAVPKRNYRAFRSAMKRLGFIIPDGQLPT